MQDITPKVAYKRDPRPLMEQLKEIDERRERVKKAREEKNKGLSPEEITAREARERKENRKKYEIWKHNKDLDERKFRKELFERNEGFVNHLTNILNDHLKFDFWEEEDPDGKSGGVIITLEFEGDDEHVVIKDGQIGWEKIDEEGNIEEVLLSEDQLKIVEILLKEYEEQEMEEMRDAEEWRKGPYHYHGVSIRDFI